MGEGSFFGCEQKVYAMGTSRKFHYYQEEIIKANVGVTVHRTDGAVQLWSLTQLSRILNFSHLFEVKSYVFLFDLFLFETKKSETAEMAEHIRGRILLTSLSVYFQPFELLNDKKNPPLFRAFFLSFFFSGPVQAEAEGRGGEQQTGVLAGAIPPPPPLPLPSPLPPPHALLSA